MAHFLAIDGGGTTTTCVVGDEKSVLATATGPASNIIRVGEERGRSALHEAIRKACASAKVEPKNIARTCAGVAGGGRQAISEKIKRIIGEVVSGEVQVVGDMVIALEAAFPGAPGVVVIAGTGSIAFGRNSQGESWRAGGWGYAVSDEGSGYWIGRTAVRFALRARDEGHATGLLSEIMRGFGAANVDELVRAVNSPGADFAAIAPAVIALAEKDDFARGVLSFAAKELAGLADIVIRRVWDAQQHVPVASAGGVFRNSSLLRDLFYNELRALWPGISPLTKVIEPVQGALYLARRG